MQELMLISNPYGRGGRNSAYVAPYSYYKPSARKRVHVPGYVRSGRIKGGTMKNPVKIGAIGREWFQGVDVMDAGAALGGLMASTMLPGMFVKESSTTMGKLLKLGAALASAAGAGFVFRNISATAGKMAVAGGMAGALSQAIGMWTNIQIGRPSSRGRLGEAINVTPPFSRSDEQVQLIRP